MMTFCAWCGVQRKDWPKNSAIMECDNGDVYCGECAISGYFNAPAKYHSVTGEGLFFTCSVCEVKFFGQDYICEGCRS